MNESIESREALWDKFLQRWPLESLAGMTLEQYSRAGDQDCFVYWLESLTESLGSIWGGSAFKFGVYSRREQREKVSDSERSYSTDYAWYSQYGDTAEEAFVQVLGQIVLIAQAARCGDLDAVEQARLGPALKWKLAFLYQSPDQPCVLPIYGLRFLRAVTRQPSMLAAPALQRELMAARGEKNLFAYADACWATATAWLQAQAVGEQALAYLMEQPERFTPISITQKVAGFRLMNGRELALIRDGKRLTLFVAPGIWLDSLSDSPLSRDDYPAERNRNSNLRSCSPDLANGHEAVCITLNGIEALEALCSAYEAAELSSADKSFAFKGAVDMPGAPLNQILFGPPGTGKTYATIDAALQVLDPTYLHEQQSNRSALKQRFDELVEQDRIRFVTFHQSFSYEDFVEGLRAITDETSGQLRYAVVDGIFKSLCDAAAAKVTQQAEAPTEVGQRRIWKMSLGNTLGEDASIYQECLVGGYVLLGYGGAINFSGCSNRQQVQTRFAEAGVVPANPATDYGITSVTAFVSRMKVGDLIVVSDGNFKFRAIGEVTGDYQFKPHPEFEADYSQLRTVKWLRQYQPSLPHTELLNGQFSQMTLYELREPTLNREKLKALLGSPDAGAGRLLHVGQRFGQGYVVRSVGQDVVEFDKPRGGVLPLPLSLLRQLLEYVRSGQIDVEDIRQGRVFEKVAEAEIEKYIVNGYQSLFAAMVEQLIKPQQGLAVGGARVLVIDEINRGNISRVFGELITLIEPSKRAGTDEALSVVLPYSKQRFSVPKNVYLIGTMNTTDRSLAGLDIALRRRFVFQEMPPRPELLDDIEVSGLNVGQLLRVMNQRIEVLLDREHCLGHAYFMPLKDETLGDAGRLTKLQLIFRNQILPLLQEYFFEDWQRIQWVLNDHRKPAPDRFAEQDKQDVAALFGNISVPAQGGVWRINESAFKRLSAYAGVIAVHDKAEMSEEEPEWADV
ncbi:AAA family ATPase [Pseudomonas tohonis]|uniref:AAA family ATPase n=1 Tax=Pseudomonas tohonis TaxID=2725477 RepID=UPI002954B5C5|nr:AAA family ATPase [Pseudomonas tohonis]